jgi:outer membrane protein OmpA-like peptidoglycan-associated protein
VAQLQDVAGAISDDAEVTITGYTDRVGDAVGNRQLSLDRAKAVQSALRAIRQHAGHAVASQQMTVHGLGNEQEVFNNDLPEGRLLSRMVQITIMKRPGP